jgi:mRNA interferase YafQ
MPRSCDYSKDFVRAWDRYEKSGRVDLNVVKTLIALLINADAPLPAQYKDHELQGDWKGYRDCHVRGDHLLIYKIGDDGRSVLFADMGTHAELFKGG